MSKPEGSETDRPYFGVRIAHAPCNVIELL